MSGIYKNVLSVNSILPFLTVNGMAGKIHVFDSVASTNDTAAEMAVAGAPHGTAVIAGGQTAGRGRYGRPFASPPGRGIYMSAILDTSFLWPETPELTTVFAAVAVCGAIEAVSGKKPEIKWVNDILIGGKKVCGILAEAAAGQKSGSINKVVVGIGVNIDTPAHMFPEGLRETAGPVFSPGERAVPRERLVAKILNNLVQTDKNLSQKELIEKYKSRLTMLGGEIEIITPSETYPAVAAGIDEAGRLIVRKTDGETRAISSGEISVRVK